MTIFTASVQEDDSGELFIELPPELTSAAGWKEGDTIEWLEGCNDTFILVKKEEITKT